MEPNTFIAFTRREIVGRLMARLAGLRRLLTFDSLLAVGILGALVLFTIKLSITSASAGAGSSKPKYTLELLTSPDQVRSSIRTALSGDSVTVWVGIPSDRIDWLTGVETSSPDESREIDRRLSDIVRLLVSDFKPATKRRNGVRVYAPTPRTVYDYMVDRLRYRSISSIRTLWPAEYEAARTDLEHVIDVRETGSFLISSIVLRTNGLSIVPYAYGNMEYMHIFYGPEIDRAVAKFKKSDPAYIASIQAYPEYTRSPQTESRLFVEQRTARRIPFPLSDTAIQQRFFMLTDDPFLLRSIPDESKLDSHGNRITDK